MFQKNQHCKSQITTKTFGYQLPTHQTEDGCHKPNAESTPSCPNNSASQSMNLSNRKESAAETFKSTSLIGLSYKGKGR